MNFNVKLVGPNSSLSKLRFIGVLFILDLKKK